MLPPLLLVPTPALAQAARAPDPEESERCLGAELERLQVRVGWSAYGDVLLQGDSNGTLTFDAWHVNPILRAALTDSLSTEIELEFEHGGTDVLPEYAFTEWKPESGFVARAGKLLVPLGRYNTDLHPSFRWVQATRPEFVERVVPAVWSEAGAELGYALRPLPGLSIRAILHVGNGLAGTIDPADPATVRDARPEGLDNNLDKGVGGRLTVEAVPAVGVLRLDLSAYRSALEDGGGGAWSAADVALSASLGPLDLLAEGAATWLDAAPLAWGGYAMAAVRFDPLVPAVRLDLDGSPGGDDQHERGRLPPLPPPALVERAGRGRGAAGPPPPTCSGRSWPRSSSEWSPGTPGLAGVYELKPRATSSSALARAAPAAPRTVLWARA